MQFTERIARDRAGSWGHTTLNTLPWLRPALQGGPSVTHLSAARGRGHRDIGRPRSGDRHHQERHSAAVLGILGGSPRRIGRAAPPDRCEHRRVVDLVGDLAGELAPARPSRPPSPPRRDIDRVRAGGSRRRGRAAGGRHGRARRPRARGRSGAPAAIRSDCPEAISGSARPSARPAARGAAATRLRSRCGRTGRRRRTGSGPAEQARRATAGRRGSTRSCRRGRWGGRARPPEPGQVGDPGVSEDHARIGVFAEPARPRARRVAGIPRPAWMSIGSVRSCASANSSRDVGMVERELLGARMQLDPLRARPQRALAPPRVPRRSG